MNPVARRYRHSSFTSQQRLLLQKSPSYAEADCQHQRRWNSDDRRAQWIALKPYPQRCDCADGDQYNRAS